MSSEFVRRTREFFNTHSHIPWEERLSGIVVKPKDENGFAVWFEESRNGEIVVGCDGWHEHFRDPDEALKCFCFCLSDGARLVVTERGGFRYKWLLQYQDADEWVDDQVTGLLIFPFWRKKRVFVLQNSWIAWPLAGRE